MGVIGKKIKNKESLRLSYSSLTRLINEGVGGFLNPIYKRNKYLEKGTIIDKVVFGEKFTEIILDIPIPKPQPKSVIEWVCEQKLDLNLESITSACKELGVKSVNYQKMLDVVLDFPEYYEYAKSPEGKFLKPNYDVGVEIGKNVLKDKKSMLLLTDGIYQFEHTFEYRGYNIFIKADCLHVDDDFKLVTITDLKSSSVPFRFPDSVMKYLYHLQAVLYIMAVEDYVLKEKTPDYTINDFHWIVCNSQKPEAPLVYPISEEELEVGKLLLENTLDRLDKLFENDFIEDGIDYKLEASEKMCQ